ncbi:hypothetical protein OJ997_01895 [Solirubrobacter phytolaccae]|uniref:Uncharacterized protein n=1 Tax=Solirubrobacter phytolaccae TaxID=1404360 RepID=A0A9X3S7D5_9ACTN|nr:hypothetical protein [Solirubrobacter phytolaccae]MDA0179031.1 hypothetical protein [Solirubrobacter phytolaccae]
MTRATKVDLYAEPDGARFRHACGFRAVVGAPSGEEADGDGLGKLKCPNPDCAESSFAYAAWYHDDRVPVDADALLALGEAQPERSEAGSPAPLPAPAPTPVHTENGEGSEKWNDFLLAEHEAGRLTPAAVAAPSLPSDAPPLAAVIYREMLLLWGLRLASIDDRPLPYASNWAVQRGHCRHHAQARRALSWLERRGVIRYAGSMPKRGKRDGTKTFLPGGPVAGLVLPAGALGVEADRGAGGHVEALDQAAQEVPVRHAVADDREVVGEDGDVFVAAGDGTGVLAHDDGSRGVGYASMLSSAAAAMHRNEADTEGR